MHDAGGDAHDGGSRRRILRIQCPDEVGLVHRATGVLLDHGLNIVANAEFVDARSGQFFMRTEAEGEWDAGAVLDRLRRVLPARCRLRLSSRRPRDLVVLVTREAHCLGDLLVRQAYGDLKGVIRAVISNHPTLQPLAAGFGVPFHVVSHEGLSRGEHEAEVLRALEPYRPEYLVLARYMRVLTPEFIERFPRRILNIHHSFLPAFIGARPYHQAAERGVKVIGATAHFVTADLDQGPIIAQDVIAVDHRHDGAAMARAGRDVEKVVLARALELVLDERVFVTGNRTVILG